MGKETLKLSNGKVVEKKIYTLYECAQDLANRVLFDGNKVRVFCMLVQPFNQTNITF